MPRHPTPTHLVLAAHLVLGALLLVAAPLLAQPERVIDLLTVDPADGVAEWVYGAGGQGNFGVPVAGGHDVDGDGNRDFAVGFMTAEPLGRFRAGEVDLVFGDGTIGGGLDTSLDSPDLLRFQGAGPRENAGSEIWMDDVTGDGLADLLICRQNHRPDVVRIGAGALTIVPGGAALRARALSGVPVDLASPPAELGLTTLIGEAALDRLCIWTRTGDVTGDGIADLVVAADQADSGGATNSGAIYVVRGGPHLAGAGVLDLASTTTLVGQIVRIEPPLGATRWHLGATCQIADLDGNGRAEVLAAATLNRAGASLVADGAVQGSAEASGGAPNGLLYILWDNNFTGTAWPKGWTFRVDQAMGSVSRIQGASTPNVSFGEELLGGLDYDGDRAADLFVGDLVADGTPSANRPQSGIGYVFYRARDLKGLTIDLDSPPPGLAMTTILGPNSGAIGADTAAHGRVDGDTLADLYFTSPHADPAGRNGAGAVHVLFGRHGGWPALIDLAPANFPSPDLVRITEIRGAHGTLSGDVGDTLAYSAAAGDLDDDGLIDLITNEMVGNGVAPGTVDVGNLIVINAAASAGVIFADGFERGDPSRWSEVVMK